MQRLVRYRLIGLTAFALSSDREKCLHVGCDEYEPKPVDFERLHTKMRSLLASDLSAKVTAYSEEPKQ